MKKGRYSASNIAEYVISYCKEKDYLMTNLKLQKVLYFIQAEFLVSAEFPCFEEEIEAWDFGPVIPEVYHKYKFFGNSNIPTFYHGNIKLLSDNDMERINEMIDECNQYSASDLTRITLNQKPWKTAYYRLGLYKRNKIDKTSILDYFSEKE